MRLILKKDSKLFFFSSDLDKELFKDYACDKVSDADYYVFGKPEKLNKANPLIDRDTFLRRAQMLLGFDYNEKKTSLIYRYASKDGLYASDIDRIILINFKPEKCVDINTLRVQHYFIVREGKPKQDIDKVEELIKKQDYAELNYLLIQDKDSSHCMKLLLFEYIRIADCEDPERIYQFNQSLSWLFHDVKIFRLHSLTTIQRRLPHLCEILRVKSLTTLEFLSCIKEIPVNPFIFVLYYELAKTFIRFRTKVNFNEEDIINAFMDEAEYNRNIEKALLLRLRGRSEEARAYRKEIDWSRDNYKKEVMKYKHIKWFYDETKRRNIPFKLQRIGFKAKYVMAILQRVPKYADSLTKSDFIYEEQL